MFLHDISFTPCLEKETLEQAGMKFIRVDKTDDNELAMYRVLDKDGSVIMDSVAEEFDNPEKWKARSEGERNALMILARDAQYGEQWDK